MRLKKKGLEKLVMFLIYELFSRFFETSFWFYLRSGLGIFLLYFLRVRFLQVSEVFANQGKHVFETVSFLREEFVHSIAFHPLLLFRFRGLGLC